MRRKGREDGPILKTSAETCCRSEARVRMTKNSRVGSANGVAVSMADSGHNGHKAKRPKPKRPQTETATNRNGHRPKRPQTETATNRNGHKPKRLFKPERPQTGTATNTNIFRYYMLVGFRFVAVPVYGRSGLWPFCFVALSVCGRFGCGRFGMWPLWPVTSMAATPGTRMFHVASPQLLILWDKILQSLTTHISQKSSFTIHLSL